MSAPGVHYTNPTGSMSPQSQSPFVRLLPTADPAAHPVPIYTTQEVSRHAVPIPVGAAPLRQHNNGPQNQNTNIRPTEQNPGEHYRYSGNRPSPLQIPPSSGNPQHPHPNPSPSAQPHSALLPISPHDRSSPANNTQSARRHSDPSHSHPEKPHTPSQATFDPLIISATDVALAPVRSALETVWTLSVNNVRLAMNKMNHDFTFLATQERNRNAHFASRVSSLEAHMHAAAQDLQILRKEKQELQNIVQAYKEQNKKLLLEKEHWEIERRVLMEGRRGDTQVSQVDMNKVLGAVTEQVSKEMEQKMMAILNQIEEQKTSRTQAERRFSETLQHLSDIHNRESSETLPVVQQSPYVLAQSPPLQRSHSPASTCVVSPDLSKAKLSSSAQQAGTDGAWTPITPTDCRSMTPAVIPRDSTLVSTSAEVLTSPSAMHTSPSPTHRRTPSFNDQPRKRPRLMSVGEEDECSTPIPESSSSAVFSQPEALKADHIPETLPENVPSPMQLSESKYDEGGPYSGTVTIKPEPLEGENMDIEDSKGATPSSSPSTRATPAESAPIRNPTPEPTVPHPSSIPNALPANQRYTKLGIGHIDLLYRTDNGVMTCRMCLSRSRDLLLSRDRSSKVAPVKKFEQTKATWEELVTHCREDHSKTCRNLERLGPTQLAEMKQRLMSGEKSMIARS